MNQDYEYAPPTLRYAHPFSLADLEELDINLVAAGTLLSLARLPIPLFIDFLSILFLYLSTRSTEIERLQRSIERLKSTNDQLNEAANEPGLASHEKQEYLDIVAENDVAMDTQKERIGMCVWTLKKRLGIDPKNKHYDLDQDTTAITITKRELQPNQSEEQDSAQSRATTQIQEDHDQQEDGLFL